MSRLTCGPACSLAGVANEVGDAYAAECVAEKGEAGKGGEARLEFGDTGEVTDGVLRERVGPTADDGEVGGNWRGRGAELPRWTRIGLQDAGEFEAGDGGDLVVVAAGDAVGDGAPEKSPDKAATGRDTVGELLVDEGACKQKDCAGSEPAS